MLDRVSVVDFKSQVKIEFYDPVKVEIQTKTEDDTGCFMTWIEVGVEFGVSLGTWVGVGIWDGVGFRDQGRVSRRRLRPDLGLGQSWISIPGSGFRTQSRVRFQVPKPNLEFSKET
ncbi:hypothetical protein TIFTF001_038125 [Ficus carica]|uniref:Uncharacterized protein n=1 Tax=Ficus carica TaxID=3494 RepID=A0AA88E6R4_FICCA|nr:hypothetical protein TIFTF001_038125 [Ficus carica]